jgi:hypothetical protein
MHTRFCLGMFTYMHMYIHTFVSHTGTRGSSGQTTPRAYTNTYTCLHFVSLHAPEARIHTCTCTYLHFFFLQALEGALGKPAPHDLRRPRQIVQISKNKVGLYADMCVCVYAVCVCVFVWCVCVCVCTHIPHVFEKAKADSPDI